MEMVLYIITGIAVVVGGWVSIWSFLDTQARYGGKNKGKTLDD